MVFNAIFNNISVISWWSILLVEEAEVSGENHRPAKIHCRICQSCISDVKSTIMCLFQSCGKFKVKFPNHQLHCIYCIIGSSVSFIIALPAATHQDEGRRFQRLHNIDIHWLWTRGMAGRHIESTETSPWRYVYTINSRLKTGLLETSWTKMNLRIPKLRLKELSPLKNICLLNLQIIHVPKTSSVV